jgi:hypothetical protein
VSDWLDGLDLAVVSPSYKRAGAVRVRKWWPEVVLAVIESQAAEYEEKEGGPLLVLPDSVGGNIARTRNEILDRLHADHEWVLTVDDDLSEIGWMHRGKQHPFSPEERERALWQGCTLAEQAGAYLWGFNVQADPKFYREYTPFAFLSPVLGPFTCHRRGSGCRYDERLPLKEDYDYWLQHVRAHHRTFRFNGRYYRADHFDLAGGVTSYRNMDGEREQLELLQRKWGPRVVTYNLAKSVNPKVRPPIPGV